MITTGLILYNVVIIVQGIIVLFKKIKKSTSEEILKNYRCVIIEKKRELFSPMSKMAMCISIK